MSSDRRFSESSFPSESDGLTIATYNWSATGTPKGVVQIAHGMAEHARRYDRLATALANAGYHVYANDHRGHGASVWDPADLGDFGTGGWEGLYTDVADFGRAIAAEQPGLPLFLLGHSMGSFASQNAIIDSSSQYAGLVLSGSTALAEWAQLFATDQIPAMDLGGVEPRTGVEWLTRDEAEQDAFVADPLAGFAMAADALPQVYGSGTRVADLDNLRRIRSELPILAISGDADRLAMKGDYIRILADRYREAGIVDVTVKLYPGARHEVFNETNRDEATAYLVEWLDAHN